VAAVLAALSGSPAALSGNPDALGGNPEALGSSKSDSPAPAP
jgi:hypothetical protein